MTNSQDLLARLREVVLVMRQDLVEMEQDTDRTSLSGMSPDDAFENGYRSAIQDLERLIEFHESSEVI